ncbi:sigma-E processing peptidase SpoIIGA [Caldibacillus lycopersici]|uniref:Sporulation sigma-E factor-processing peptidase n=1 Tax=Perspicuibacillus lycopersici TaxID=1325689 RepID=A0AAE3LPB9_9BACI|nr:sigma-E processing peptidase SpoIIGA [Perspicuibacillus lycopersici]MCU9612189.1 sigma-E processing peptidase SpoIIGA [Perspicuibacillus lycopersici]
MPIYLDIIWLLNFLFDSLLLFITGLILKRPLAKRKIFFGGLLGSLIIFAPFSPFAAILSSPIMKIVLSIIMVWVSFGFKKFRFFFTNICMFYLCTFAAGGTLIGLHYLFSFQFNLSNSLMLNSIRGFGDPISWIFIVFGFPLVLYFSRQTFDRFETAKIQFDQLVDVTIVINQQSVQLKGLIDSGNHLYDPLTKKPVMIVSLNHTKHLFPIDLLNVFENANNLWNLEGELMDEWLKKISIIPYRVVGQENRLIAAVKPDQIIIQKEEDVIQTNQLFLAFVNQSLSSDDTFECIVHPKIINKAIHKQVS